MATIGTAGVPSQNTINYDALLSTTLMNYRKTLYDNIFKDSAFLAALRLNGAVTKQNGGERIAMPLMYGTNSTVKSYEGYETLDTTPQDGMTTAFYEWKEIAGTISISRKEERQNSGEGRIIGLLESKTKQAEMSLRETLNQQLLQGAVDTATFVPGNSGKDLNPLGYFCRKDPALDPVAGGDVGNISNVGESWWRNKAAVIDSGSATDNATFALAVTTYAGLKVAVKRMRNHTARGSGGAANLLVGDQNSFETYENALDINVRFQNTKLGDMGFDAVRVGGSEFIWDEVVPDIDSGTVALTTGTIFYINTNFYNLVIDSETDLVTTPFIEPENQTAKTAKILFMGNAACSNLRKMGVLYAISQSIAS